MQEKGVLVKTVGGKVRTFKYGMKTSLKFSAAFEMSKTSRIEFLIGVLWAGLIGGDKDGSNDLPKDFSTKEVGMDIVADWIDGMSLEDCAEIYNVAEAALGFTMQVIDQAKKQQEIEPIP